MKKFLVLYGASRETMEEWSKSSPEDQKKGMDAWIQWGENHKNDLADFGAPVGKNKRITKDGATDAPNEIGGYSIVQAESYDDAVKVFADSPHFEGGADVYIELMELVDMS